MILDKYCEWHYFGEDERLFPDCIQGPGSIFNMQIIFDEENTVDNNVLSASAGALSSFLLPSVGCTRKHSKIQKQFEISYPAPKTPYEHYRIFKELLNHKNSNTSWYSQLLYFSEEFIEKTKNDKEWIALKLYFSEALRKKLTQNTYDAAYYDLFLSAKKINRFRPTPFIIDTAKYIFNICMGSGIGVKPATNDQYFPVHAIQKIYNEDYGLQYTPTIMVPSSLAKEQDTIYYPLQCPFTKINTFKTNQSNSTLSELETLKNVLLAYQEEFTDKHGDAYGSPIYHISNKTKFRFYHYQSNGINQIKNSEDLLNQDNRFTFSYCNKETLFASDAKLFRGCIQICRL